MSKVSARPDGVDRLDGRTHSRAARLAEAEREIRGLRAALAAVTADDGRSDVPTGLAVALASSQQRAWQPVRLPGEVVVVLPSERRLITNPGRTWRLLKRVIEACPQGQLSYTADLPAEVPVIARKISGTAYVLASAALSPPGRREAVRTALRALGTSPGMATAARRTRPAGRLHAVT